MNIDDRVELWDAINAVVAASGGDTGNTGVSRQKAVVLVEGVVDRMVDRRGWVCIRHRCAKHYDVPAQNTNEASGAECGGCIAEERDAALTGKETALEWNRLACKQRDDLRTKLDQAENIARMNGAERDQLKAEVERLGQLLGRIDPHGRDPRLKP